MSRLIDALSEYASAHRDPRNLAPHAFGIPIILLGSSTLLSRPGLPAEPRLLSPALLLAVIAALYYLRLDRRLGWLMGLLLALDVAAGHCLAGLPTASWLGIGLGLLLAGWALQCWGHALEGRRPAFLDDSRQLLIGPLYITVELGFLLGWGHPLQQAIEHRAGRRQRRRDAPSQTVARH